MRQVTALEAAALSLSLQASGEVASLGHPARQWRKQDPNPGPTPEPGLGKDAPPSCSPTKGCSKCDFELKKSGMRSLDMKGQILTLFSIQKQLIYSMFFSSKCSKKRRFLANWCVPKFVFHVLLFLCNCSEHNGTTCSASGLSCLNNTQRDQYRVIYQDNLLALQSPPSPLWAAAALCPLVTMSCSSWFDLPLLCSTHLLLVTCTGTYLLVFSSWRSRVKSSPGTSC